MVLMRKCNKCGLVMDSGAFYDSRPDCKECTKSRVKDWRGRNMDKAVKYNKKWREKNLDKWHSIKLAQYGLTAEDYDRMLEYQDGVCAICGGVSRDRRLSVDHCHDTGRVRGLLCIKCNSAIGYLPTTDLLDSAKRYLSWS